MRGEGNIKIPRSRCAREMLAKNGLIGKVTLTSDMDEDKIHSDIFSVFQKAMRKDPVFPFTILQPAGGTSKSLMIPSLSTSYRWTASVVAGKNAKLPIYILAEADLEVSPEAIEIIFCLQFSASMAQPWDGKCISLLPAGM